MEFIEEIDKMHKLESLPENKYETHFNSIFHSVAGSSSEKNEEEVVHKRKIVTASVPKEPSASLNARRPSVFFAENTREKLFERNNELYEHTLIDGGNHGAGSQTGVLPVEEQPKGKGVNSLSVNVKENPLKRLLLSPKFRSVVTDNNEFTPFPTKDTTLSPIPSRNVGHDMPVIARAAEEILSPRSHYLEACIKEHLNPRPTLVLKITPTFADLQHQVLRQ